MIKERKDIINGIETIQREIVITNKNGIYNVASPILFYGRFLGDYYGYNDVAFTDLGKAMDFAKNAFGFYPHVVNIKSAYKAF